MNIYVNKLTYFKSLLPFLFSFFQLQGSDTIKWEWVNPQPTGNYITSLTGDRNTHELFLTTGNNDLLVSNDGGYHWESRTMACEFPLKNLKIHKDNIFSLSDSAIILSTDRGSTWNLLKQFSGYIFSDLFVKNDSCFFITGNKTIYLPPVGYTYPVERWHMILKSDDAGLQWDTLSEFKLDIPSIDKILFNSDSSGYIICRDGFENYYSYNVLRTRDKGITWETDSITESLQVKDLFFNNQDTGYCVTNLNDFYETFDNGLSWNFVSHINSSQPVYLYKQIEALNDSVFILKTDRGFLFSLDRGKHWNDYIKQMMNPGFFNFFFVTDISNSFGSSVFNDYIISSDTGKTWNYLHTDFTRKYFSAENSYVLASSDISFINSNLGYARIIDQYENNIIVKTTNGGCSWEDVYKSYGDIRKIFFFNDTIGYFTEGGIATVPKHHFYTMDGGKSWNVCKALNKDFGYYISSMDFFDIARGVFIDEYNNVYFSTDTGKTWTSSDLNSYDMYTFSDHKIKTTRNNTAFIMANDGVAAKSDDYGQSWHRVVTNTDARLNGVDFLNADVGYMVGHDGNQSTGYGVILKTTNGGETWDIIQRIENMAFNDIKFLNNDTGLIVGNYGAIYLSKDRGTTWGKINSITNNELRKIFSFNDGSLYITDLNSVFIRKQENKPNSVFNIKQQSICKNSVLNIENESANSRAYTWKIENNDISHNKDLSYAINDTGLVTITLIASNCVYSDTSKNTVRVLPLPDKPIFYLNDSVIDRDTIVIRDTNLVNILYKNRAYDFSWNTESKDSVITVAANKIIFLTATNEYGCKIYSDTLNVLFEKDSVQSEKYFPFPAQNVNWNVYLISGCDNDAPPDTFLLRYTLYGDTVINDIQYKRLCLESGDTLSPHLKPVGGIREDNRKVYFTGQEYLEYLYEEEILLYDFSKSIGDTIKHDISGEIFSVIDDIDSILIGDDYRKRYRININGTYHNPDYVIEGIGSVVNGLLGHITKIPTCGQHYWEHICFREDNVVKYLNPVFGDCFPTWLLSPVKNFFSKGDISIYPNPTDEVLIIENNSGNNISTLKITDLSGRIVMEERLNGNKTIIRFRLNPGLYNVMVIDNTGQIIKIKKIIKT